MGKAFDHLMGGEPVTGRFVLKWPEVHELFGTIQYAKTDAGPDHLGIAYGTVRLGCGEPTQSIVGGIVTEGWTHNVIVEITELMEGSIKIDGGALGERPVRVEELGSGSDHYHFFEKAGGTFLGSVDLVVPPQIN